MITKNNIIWLSEQQKKLDAYIVENHQLKVNKEMLRKKIIAFLVELGEYANEERSFKYWSKKPSSDLAMQLDEYIDGLHFILSIGNQINVDFNNFAMINFKTTTNLDCYFEIISLLAKFSKEFDLVIYQELLSCYLNIAKIKNYSEEELLNAYKIKNKINFERQNNNY
ncbi:dUTP diphosphatase [Williamsoniiplasma somnilux]|uniref:dUTP diphosphatase n=1 Tax=Williamsoniiplasma somnilux TaxID=215578 RepID=A0A2K8NY22_9MOLU|nr:dUTP diphosphatase [Williamsoniiplasma somnilux]ATZ18644.1 dUTP diphosphatase [Williamsoniiplasma somnilux]